MEARAATEERWPLSAGGPAPPQPPAPEARKARTRWTTLPAQARRRRGSESPGHRPGGGGGGAPTRGKDRGTGADPGSIAPECALETSLPPSCLRATVPRGEEGEECVLPFHLFCLLLSATGRGKRGAPPRAPCPGALASRSRAIAQQEALPFLAPSFQPFSGRHRKRMERIRKKPRGAYLHFL